MFRFTLIGDNGKAITENTKIISKGVRVIIANNEQLAEYIYAKWKRLTKSKSFTEWCDAINAELSEDEHRFELECAIDHLTGAFELWLNTSKIELFDFMCVNLPSLKKIGGLDTTNEEYFEVLFGNGAGVYNLLNVIEHAATTGFISTVTTIDDEDIAEEAERAENHIQKLCAENIMFGCTGNGDWVFAHKENECWSC